MTASYNPFEILNLPILRGLIQRGNRVIVLQRFRWPGIAEHRGFIGTPYRDEPAAKKHIAQLSDKEGKLLDLNADLEKIIKLMGDPKYHLFLSAFRDPKWQAGILKHYQQNIVSFLRAEMSMEGEDPLNIDLTLEYGRLKVSVILNEDERVFDAFEMIK